MIVRSVIITLMLCGMGWAQGPLPGNGAGSGSGGGSGTVTAVTCGTGLNGGTITASGTCSEKVPWLGWIDPVQSENAAGVVTTTTGTIPVSSHVLTVGSTTGWTAGMGIAVPGAGVAAATLVTSVSSVGSGVLNLTAAASTAVVSAATIQHDDSAAICAAVGTGLNVHLPAGSYNMTSGCTISTPQSFVGDGEVVTLIYNRSTTANILTVNWNQVSFNYPTNPVVFGGTVSDFSVSQASDVTPTAGYAVVFGSGVSNQYTVNLHIKRLLIQGTCGGIKSVTGGISDWVQDVYVSYLYGCGTGYDAIYINNASPGGDVDWDDINLGGPSTGVTIVSADTQEFTNLKLNGQGIAISPSSDNAVQRIRFINPSIEGSNSGTAVTISGHIAAQVTFVNPMVGLWSNGYSISSAANFVLVGGSCYLIQNGGACVAVGGSSTGTISGMTLNGGSGTTQIYLVTSASVTLSGLDINSSGQYFIYTDSSIATVYAANNNNPGNVPNNLNAATTLIPLGGGSTNFVTCVGSSSTSAPTCAGIPAPQSLGNSTVGYISGVFVAGATSTGALTINVNSIGAKTAYLNGLVVSSTNTVISGTTYRFNYDGTYIQLFGGIVPVASGGTGLSSGTSGGVPCYTSTTAITSSVLLTTNAPVVGGGSGACPSALGITVPTQTDGATVTWALGSAWSVTSQLTFTTHGGNRTLNITNPLTTGWYTLKLIQDATGGEGLILGTGCTWQVLNNGVPATTVTLSSTANGVNVLSFYYDGTNCVANLH